jgi:hypothetical protein
MSSFDLEKDISKRKFSTIPFWRAYEQQIVVAERFAGGLLWLVAP